MMCLRLTDTFHFQGELSAWLAKMTPFYATKGIQLLVVAKTCKNGKSAYIVWRTLNDSDYTAKTMLFTKSGNTGNTPLSVYDYHQQYAKNALREFVEVQ
jgi:hypothetical protein